MFIDASALVALLIGEPGSDNLLERLDAADAVVTSPLAIYETVLALMRIRVIPRPAAQRELQEWLAAAEIAVIPITDEIGRAALDAFERYGKGRGHPAQLNMGDCFAYGAAVTLGVPLLYKGDDFAETDLGRTP
jgi:ribonuclease VapC